LCVLINDSLRTISVKNGLYSDNINAVVEDPKRQIWAVTSYGISRIDIRKLSVVNYIDQNKETNNQFRKNKVIVGTNGKLYAIADDCLVEVVPNEMENSTDQATILITDIKINNIPVIPGLKISGKEIIDVDINHCKQINVPNNHTLTLEFATLGVQFPEQLHYEYQFDDDKEWIAMNPNQQSITLPNKNSGRYLFKVKVIDSNDKVVFKEISIHYLPPYWATTVAFIIYITLILTIFLIYRKVTIQRIRQQAILEKERYERVKLEELDQMKSDFFTNISHEFRTPLTLIIDPLEKIKSDKEISEHNRNKINLVLKSSKKLLKLTNEIMDFSKIEKQQLMPVFNRADIVNFIAEIGNHFNTVAEQRNIAYNTIFPSEPLLVAFDFNMMEKIVFNLLSNAFKFTPEGGKVMIAIEHCFQTEIEFVKVSVINTGEGISPENLDKIFDRYFQVNNLHNKNTEGTGIGLSNVKSFVEVHRGKIEVTSELNSETCFNVYLPLNQENVFSESTLEQGKTRPSSGGRPDHLSFGKPATHFRILIIEDDEDIRQYVASEIAPDYKVTTATNGEDGLNLAQETMPDLIITDVMMPGISGLELCQRLKNQMITSHIPIIILSAKTRVEQQIEGLDMGADVYMLKPFSIEHLKAQISRLLLLRQTIYSRFLKETEFIPKDVILNKTDDDFMQKVLIFIESNLSNTELSVDQLSTHLNISRIHTYRKIKALTGQSAVEFIRSVRLKKAAQLILAGQNNFTEVAFDTGFSTPSYFTKCFREHFGKTPTEYLQQFRNTDEVV